MIIREMNLNVVTGEDVLTEREETAAEKKSREKFEASMKIIQTEEEKKAIAKAALLERMGLSAEEATLLLG
jgi:hypothetical protein